AGGRGAGGGCGAGGGAGAGGRGGGGGRGGVVGVSLLASRSRSVAEGIGKPVRRREDARLIAGAGCYTDDVNLPGQAYASMVRSPHAHAHIVRIDTAAALASPGVLAVLTGADLLADGLKTISHRPATPPPRTPPSRTPRTSSPSIHASTA